MQLTGAQIVVRALIDQGVRVSFGYPGGTVLNIYDALYEYREEMRHVVSSHEQGAAHAADGYARATGETGVVIATSGPGATNLVTGIANAYHDSVPLIAITANVTQDLMGRDTFQEVDIAGVTNPIVKHNYIVQDPAKLAETIRQAFTIANSGRKGPVLIDIPKDVTAAKAEYNALPRFALRPDPVPGEPELARAAQALAEAKRPLLYAGGGVTFSDCSEQLLAFSKWLDAPICVSMMGLSSVPYDYPLYLGMIGMHGTATANIAAGECDLLIAVGARFSDRVTGNRGRFAPGAKVLHIDIDASEISKNIPAEYPLVGGAGDVMRRLMERVPQGGREQWTHRLLKHKAFNALPDKKSEGDDINPREMVARLRAAAGEDAVVVTDVGQHQMLTAQYYPFRQPRSFISSSGLGAMGYGMGAAVGAQMGCPERRVVLVSGDGSFHMNMAEMAVAVSNNLPIVVVVLNNSVLGMVHQWQKLFYDSRFAYTEIARKTDFVKLAEAFGAVGLRVDKSGDIDSVLAEAFASGRPCIVDCVISEENRVFPMIPAGGSGADMIYAEDPADEKGGNA